MSISSIADAPRTSLYDRNALPFNFQDLMIALPSPDGPAQAIADAALSPDQRIPLEHRSVLVIVETPDSDEN